MPPGGSPSPDTALDDLFGLSDPEERLAQARRLVADRCLYGVDKNPLAVEMAKLSLWLITLQRDRPFTFLDHALRCGDSLLGMSSLEQLTRWSLRTDQADPKLDDVTKPVVKALHQALALRREIRATPVIDALDTDYKAQLLARAEQTMSLLHLGADLLVAAALVPDAKSRDERHGRFLTRYVRHPRLKLVGLRLNPKVGHHRPSDIGPITDIARSVVVSRGCMTTHDTTKGSLRTAVCPFSMTTDSTPLTCVGRVNGDKHDPGPLRLIRDEGPQLTECPIAVPCSLYRPANPCPRADMRQVFNAYRSLRAFGLRNELLAYLMVPIFLKPTLPPGPLFQPTCGRLRANRLQRLTAIRIPLPFALYILARMHVTVTVYCQIDDTKVNPKHRINVLGIGLLNLARHQQIPRATVEPQIAFPLPGFQHAPLALTTNKGDGLAIVQCPDRNLGGRKGKGEDTVIIRHRGQWPKRAHGVVVQLVRIPNLRNGPNRQLGRQAKIGPYLLIAPFLKRKLAKGAGFPTQLR